MFTGRFPYGEIEPFTRPRFRPPTALTQHRPDLPAWLDRAIARAIAINPADRYQDIIEFVFEMEHGAERASPIHLARRPLYARNPLLFWKTVSALLALLVAVTFFTAVKHGRGRPGRDAGSTSQHR
jgi:hypothetical protein